MGFISQLRPLIVENLPFASDYKVEGLYRYFNMVKADLVRVEADELTYNFHIALRYELEKKLIGGQVKTSELPSLRSEMMDSYLEVKLKDDSEGVLQDMHWSSGLFGYFPSYSLGKLLAGMIWGSMRKELELEQLAINGNLDPIKSWLYNNFHKYGSVYTPKELARRSFGERYNPERLIRYFELKYLGS